MGYSDEWQPYKGDYDKFEYDIKLADGSVVVNCYPNAGTFTPLQDQENIVNEKDVTEIRFSEAPVTQLNYNVSENCRRFFEQILLRERESRNSMVQFGSNIELSSPYIFSEFMPKKSQYKTVSVRTEPKIGRNENCPCGSGKKHKKCCL